MSIPTQPTETTIIQKAYRLYGLSNPSSTLITEAQDAIAKVKSDLMDEGHEWSFLRKTAYLPLTINVNHVQAPTDYLKLISGTILDGTRRDTAQTGGSTTITLASTDNGTVNSTEAKDIVLTGGTGSGQARRIVDFDTSTKIVTVDEAWTTNPDSSTTYLIVDRSHDLTPSQIWNYNELEQTNTKDEPTILYHFADNLEGDFYFNNSPDKIYVLRLDYYGDLRKEDTDTATNDRYATILRVLEQVFVQGVFTWLLQNDNRYISEIQIYSSMISRQASKYLYPNSAFQSAELSEDVY